MISSQYVNTEALGCIPELICQLKKIDVKANDNKCITSKNISVKKWVDNIVDNCAKKYTLYMRFQWQ